MNNKFNSIAEAAIKGVDITEPDLINEEGYDILVELAEETYETGRPFNDMNEFSKVVLEDYEDFFNKENIEKAYEFYLEAVEYHYWER